MVLMVMMVVMNLVKKIQLQTMEMFWWRCCCRSLLLFEFLDCGRVTLELVMMQVAVKMKLVQVMVQIP
jgi:hypothetical protein